MLEALLLFCWWLQYSKEANEGGEGCKEEEKNELGDLDRDIRLVLLQLDNARFIGFYFMALYNMYSKGITRVSECAHLCLYVPISVQWQKQSPLIVIHVLEHHASVI